MLDFSAFCHDSKVIDAKYLSSTVDRQFIAATSPNPALDSDKGVLNLRKLATKSELVKLQPDSALVRY